MMETSETGGGLSVLDAAAFVTGAAVASVHIRGAIREGLSGPGWVLVWGTFTLIALTAAGPFVFLVRRYVRRLAGYPGVGDRLWAWLGLPWIVTAVLQSAAPGGVPQRNDLAALVLGAGIGVVSLIALATLWGTWITVAPEQAERVAAGPWTNRLGIALAVAWPVQCGLAMVVIG
jgi:hypothetical protein